MGVPGVYETGLLGYWATAVAGNFSGFRFPTSRAPHPRMPPDKPSLGDSAPDSMFRPGMHPDDTATSCSVDSL